MCIRDSAAGAAHGTIYFKMLDDAAFYAANSLVTDHFLLTTAFNLLLTRPLQNGPVIAEGPVSYTHLDVYKRQSLVCVLARS